MIFRLIKNILATAFKFISLNNQKKFSLRLSAQGTASITAAQGSYLDFKEVDRDHRLPASMLWQSMLTLFLI